jgi:hypothetical protein
MTRKFVILTTLAFFMVCHAEIGAAASGPLSESDLLRLLWGGVYNERITWLVHRRGVNFVPSDHDLELLRLAGADQSLLHEVMIAPRILPSVTQQPAVRSSQLRAALREFRSDGR